jgi:hypothetical protein
MRPHRCDFWNVIIGVFAIGTCVTLPQRSFARDDISRDLKEIISELSELRENTTGYSKIASEPGLGLQTAEAERAFVRAVEATTDRRWLSVVQELQRFLTLTQKPDPQMWLKAQYMIGRAYEERSQGYRAARAYMRYLAVYSTSKKADLTELTEVIERLVKVTTKASSSELVELRQFLSSIAAMNVPGSIEPELKYFLAVGGARVGERNLALSWLEDSSEDAQTPDLKARGRFFKALLAMQDQKWDEAESTLQSILSMSGVKDQTIERTRLSLARIYLKQKKPKTAMSIYESIPADSEQYRDALFEKTFANIREGQSKLARDYAIEYLEKFADHPDAMQMRVMRSWLDIHTGDLNAANQSIAATKTALVAMRDKVSSAMTGKESLSYLDAKLVRETTMGEVQIPPELEDLLSMFEQLSELDTRLSEAEGVALNALYTLAKSDIRLYKPALANRLDQMIRLINRQYQISERHIEVETARLKNSLTKIDKQKLMASQSRRKDMFSKAQQISRDAKRLVYWTGPAEQLVELAKHWNKLSTMNKSSPTKAAMADSETKGTSDQVTANQVRQDMLATLTDIRRLQAANIVRLSKIDEQKKVFEGYMNEIHESQSVLETYEPLETQTLDLLDDQDSQQAWKLIQNTSSLLYQSLDDLYRDADQNLSKTLASIDGLLSREQKQRREIALLRELLEKTGAQLTSTLIAHFDQVIGQRIAKQEKWSGDIDYLRYTKASDAHDNQTKSKDLELQILSDSLRQPGQGEPAQWMR